MLHKIIISTVFIIRTVFMIGTVKIHEQIHGNKEPILDSEFKSKVQKVELLSYWNLFTGTLGQRKGHINAIIIRKYSDLSLHLLITYISHIV